MPTRRHVISGLALTAAGLTLPATLRGVMAAPAATSTMNTRKIPASGQAI
ncbi:MAG: aldo/keto reductase, partial [Comamonadaceae bacterium]